MRGHSQVICEVHTYTQHTHVRSSLVLSHLEWLLPYSNQRLNCQLTSSPKLETATQQLGTATQQLGTATQQLGTATQQLEETETNQAEITEQPQTKGLTLLERLPVEILLSISDFLIPEDIFCLALCSSRTFVTLDRQTSNIKLPEGSGKLPFLQRLERDLPNHFICYCCILLHKYDGSESYQLSNPRLYLDHSLPCVRNMKWSMPGLQVTIHGSFLHSYYDLYFLHVQLAMRRSFDSLKSGMTSEALAYTQVREYFDSSTLASIEACVCSVDGTGSDPSLPSLCLRVQDMVLVGLDEVYLIDPSSALPINFNFLWICEHILYLYILNSITDLVKAHSESELKPTCSASSNCCEVCRTDYHIELHEFNSRDLALVITRWINLGTGQSPDDPQWKRVQSVYEKPPLLDGKELASPRVAFEKVVSDHWSKEALTLSNVSFLRNSEYRNSMEQLDYDPDVWILPTPRRASIHSYPEKKY
ncbi:unnamed protein product [Penicillium camemberti]|uniref:Str. FM013 n=1 Tax=Penicillium camemberti (strain FM 013) TaxID=1429867 RepID=A0A0G4P746_PENC3|nr:unnamed protein product [Penicillium camemberti]